MSKLILKIKKSDMLMLRNSMLRKGGKLPPGSIRNWGGIEYVKDASGEWKRKIKGKMQSSISETSHEKTLSNWELKKECFSFARVNFQGKMFINIDTNTEILVSRDGLDKWENISVTRDQCLSIKKLNVILKNAKQVSNEHDKKNRHTVDEFTYYNYKMEVNKKQYKVILITKRTHGKNTKYYGHYLKDIKIEPDSGLA